VVFSPSASIRRRRNLVHVIQVENVVVTVVNGPRIRVLGDALTATKCRVQPWNESTDQRIFKDMLTVE
jgi:hypothetical protein